MHGIVSFYVSLFAVHCKPNSICTAEALPEALDMCKRPLLESPARLATPLHMSHMPAGMLTGSHLHPMHPSPASACFIHQERQGLALGCNWQRRACLQADSYQDPNAVDRAVHPLYQNLKERLQAHHYPPLAGLLRALLHPCPSCRPSAAEALRHISTCT